MPPAANDASHALRLAGVGDHLEAGIDQRVILGPVGGALESVAEQDVHAAEGITAL